MNKVRSIGFVVMIAVLSLAFSHTPALSGEVVLKNGDRISGEIISEDEESVTIETGALGELTISKEFVEKVIVAPEAEPEPEEKPKLWQGEVAAGLNRSSGNTENIEFTVSFDAGMKTESNELTVKGDGYYSSSEGEMNAQKWYSMARYARKVWNRKWDNFYRLEADHDKFAGIDYRLIPSTGLGYSFVDTPEWKVLVEGAIGLEHTVYNDETEDTDEAVFIARVLLEKTFAAGLKITQDTSFYPSLEETSEFRVHSESALTNPLAGGLSLRLSFIVDYDSDPPEDREETDTRLVTSLLYSF